MTLEFINRQHDGWPWPFSLRQNITLDSGAFSIELTLRNLSGAEMPAGFGFHPYFSNPKTATLKFSAEGSWAPDGEGLPAEWRAIDNGLDFVSGRLLKSVSIDQCFTGWRGPAFIEWRDRPYGVEISADSAMKFAVVYVSQEEGCFCFEPVSQMNDALNWANRIKDTGLRILQPGEEWAAAMTLRAREIQR